MSRKKQGICLQNDQLDGWMSGWIGPYMSINPGWMVGWVEKKQGICVQNDQLDGWMSG